MFRRVHISETTKQLLNGEFDLEPGKGYERDEYLKLVNINTYLIRSIVKPVSLPFVNERRTPVPTDTGRHVMLLHPIDPQNRWKGWTPAGTGISDPCACLIRRSIFEPVRRLGVLNRR